METNPTDDLRRLIESSDTPVTREWLDGMKEKYPYFILPSILYLKQTDKKDVPDHDELLAQLAIAAPDRRSLCDLLGENDLKFSSFYPPEEKPVTPDTDSTLDTFLQQFGSQDEKEIEILNQIIFNPTPDYAQLLAAEEEKSAPAPIDLSADAAESLSENDLLINRFITQSKENNGYFPAKVVEVPSSPAEEPPVEKVEQPEDKDESMLSESLAKIYIKQRKYSKALQIIKTISLKFPEKSIYFADQMRFLQKLIINEKIKNKN